MTKTKFNWNEFKPLPDFDRLKWKDERQTQILKETEGMPLEEVREYFRQGAADFDRKIAEIRKKRKEHLAH